MKQPIVCVEQQIYNNINLTVSFAVRHKFSDMHLRTDIDGELVIISPELVRKHGAVCLDGTSSAGYYIKRG